MKLSVNFRIVTRNFTFWQAPLAAAVPVPPLHCHWHEDSSLKSHLALLARPTRVRSPSPLMPHWLSGYKLERLSVYQSLSLMKYPDIFKHTRAVKTGPHRWKDSVQFLNSCVSLEGIPKDALGRGDDSISEGWCTGSSMHSLSDPQPR